MLVVLTARWVTVTGNVAFRYVVLLGSCFLRGLLMARTSMVVAFPNGDDPDVPGRYDVSVIEMPPCLQSVVIDFPPCAKDTAGVIDLPPC